MEGRPLADTFAEEEDAPPPVKISLWRWTKWTRAMRMLWRRMPKRPGPSTLVFDGFWGHGGDKDAISEASMSILESELYRARIAKRGLTNQSPQQHRNFGRQMR